LSRLRSVYWLSPNHSQQQITIASGWVIRYDMDATARTVHPKPGIITRPPSHFQCF
jgi:hypothetical protein